MLTFLRDVLIVHVLLCCRYEHWAKLLV